MLRSVTRVLLALGILACDADDGALDYEKVEEGKEDSSVEATIMDFEFDAELETDWAVAPDRVVRDQLLYTIGHLNGNRSVGRLDRLELSNLQTSALPSGKTLVRYHARMPVAWGSKTNLPSSYEMRLPRDVSYAGLEAFTAKYKDQCVDFSAHEVTSGSMWYYYRPRASGCTILDADVVKTTASAVVSTVNTTGKFPEYDEVWEDDTLKVVAIFGKYEDGATSSRDAGIAAYDEFVAAVRARLAVWSPTTIPASVPVAPGVGTPDVTFRAAIGGGKSIEVVALLVDNVRTAGPTFDARYESLSGEADVIAYNGHAGLGSNVRALASKGSWIPGQYVIVFMNGCDTYAYVDGSLAQTRAAINPDDPTGTKYMEFVVNAMPAYFHSDSGASMALVNGLLDHAAPKTYEQIFRNIDRSQVVLVTGDNDNVFVPGGGGGGEPDPTWGGLDESFTVTRAQEKRWTTPSLPAGSYEFALSGTGDADLYVRTGTDPTTTVYDCRPYRSGSSETCLVDLAAPATIHIMVRGYASSSPVHLTAGER